MAEPEYATTGRVTLHTMSKSRLIELITRAAQWGADQELEACYYLMENYYGTDTADFLQQGRRPKSPRLKEEALSALEHLALGPDPTAFLADMDTIRRALEQLDD